MAKERDVESLHEHITELVDGLEAYERRHMEVMARVNEMGRRLEIVERYFKRDDVLPEHQGRTE